MNPLPSPVRPAPHRAEVAFGVPFWLTYLANSTLMVSVSLLFRYDDFVKSLGGTELNLGLIVGVGMVGSLVMRVFQAVGIDNHGPRLVWLLSIVGFVTACVGHLFVTTVDGPLVYALRILLQTSIAGVFGSSITYISGRAPVARVAEVVGTLGTSGFLGMMIGTSLGDLLLEGGPLDRQHVSRLFIAATISGVLSGICALVATHGHLRRPRTRKQPPLVWLLRRYHPGRLLLVGIAMGFGLGLPQYFLRPYTRELGIDGIATFFAIYPVIAFVFRVAIRRMPDRLGVRPTILMGLSSLAISMLLFLPVTSWWGLLLPALFQGFGHACLFPSVVAGGSGAFPMRYRGLATTLVLGMFDVGVLIAAPSAGLLVNSARTLGLPAYPSMFAAVSLVMIVVAVIYATGRRAERTGGQPRPDALQRRRKHHNRRAAAKRKKQMVSQHSSV